MFLILLHKFHLNADCFYDAKSRAFQRTHLADSPTANMYQLKEATLYVLTDADFSARGRQVGI